MSDSLIIIEGLFKKFCNSLKRSMIYGTNDVLRDFIGLNRNEEHLRKFEFWALQDINFELKRGETLALIGQNGCGKTTLLRLINGIFPPDKGKIMINGNIGALIAVGAGFHPHMSGRENIFLNGSILGLSKKEITKRLDEIIEFAEIGSFIDSPVATYSSGMTVRLGFSIAINCNPDILLVDEILAVGDVSFVGKCQNKIRSLQESGTGIILVTHNTQVILDFCQRGILLNAGRQIIDSTAGIAVKHYETLLNNEKLSKTRFEFKKKSAPSNVIKSRCYLKGLENSDSFEVSPNESLAFCYELISEIELDNAYITLAIMTIQGTNLIHIRNDFDGMGMIRIKKGFNLITITIDALNLECGTYACSFILLNRDDEKPVMDHAFLNPGLLIKGSKKNDSVIKVNRSWQIN